ncbi:hypothetical protein HOLleu_44281 [Holothuria leucospilota]|uniref:Uncharacterized protein n=1 Tax=Holothuria leucospilota TaxID=206669 RepID=A0A9Q0YAL4_HOLLE|nr:hypothetical protein HOLleu_44281 [Holothuria leucospilota]
MQTETSEGCSEHTSTANHFKLKKDENRLHEQEDGNDECEEEPGDKEQSNGGNEEEGDSGKKGSMR